MKKQDSEKISTSRAAVLEISGMSISLIYRLWWLRRELKKSISRLILLENLQFFLKCSIFQALSKEVKIDIIFDQHHGQNLKTKKKLVDIFKTIFWKCLFSKNYFSWKKVIFKPYICIIKHKISGELSPLLLKPMNFLTVFSDFGSYAVNFIELLRREGGAGPEIHV